jgi:hypothetical protein
VKSEHGGILEWQFGTLAVERLGGRLGEVTFRLPDGRRIAPLQVAPWSEDPQAPSYPPLIRRLRGEWPCVPFGFDVPRAAFSGWELGLAAAPLDVGHGFSASNEWQIEERGDAIAMFIDYPADHPVARLDRTVRPDPGASAIDLTLTIHTRRECVLPIGLHPTLRLPGETGSGMIEIEPESIAATFPGTIVETAIFEAGRFAPLHALPLRAGGTFDARHVPLPVKTEELVQILRTSGKAAFWNRQEGYRLRLNWNPEHFPSLLLWYSNRGHDTPPWNGRHLALGMEPICSAFDLGTEISARPNPISDRGVPTARRFRASETFTTAYRIALEGTPLKPGLNSDA